MPQEEERDVGEERVELVELAFPVDDGVRARKDDLIAPAQFVYQAEDAFIGLKPVVVKLFE